MGVIRSRIPNPTTVTGEVIEELNSPIDSNITTDIKYQASSTSTFLDNGTSFFLPTNLSNVNDIILLPTPTINGQSIFRDRTTEKIIPINLNGNVSDANSTIEITEYLVEMKVITMVGNP
jgi:hypothetical protein